MCGVRPMDPCPAAAPLNEALGRRQEFMRGVRPMDPCRAAASERTQTRWISVPVPSPPPQHIVTSPTSLSARSSS